MKAVNQRKLMEYIASKGISNLFNTFLKSRWMSKHIKFSKMGPTSISKLCAKVNSDDSRHLNPRRSISTFSQLTWKNGELKLFGWFLFFYCFHSGIEANQMNEKDYEFLQTIFFNQTICRLKYEVMIMTVSKTHLKKLWRVEECDLFAQVISKFSEKDAPIEWKEVAFELYSQSDGLYFRTNAQCRERWMNHLNTQIDRSQWTRKDDLTVMRMVHNEKARWADISRSLDGKRTQHMVKNRYNSLIKKWKKELRSRSDRQVEKKLIEMLSEADEQHLTSEKDQYRKTIDQSEEIIISESEQMFSEKVQHDIQKIGHSLPTFRKEDLIQSQEVQKDAEAGQLQDFLEEILTGPQTPTIRAPQSLLPTEWFSDPQLLARLSTKDSYLNYYRDEKIRQTMEEVAGHLGCHAEKLAWMFKNDQEPIVEYEWQ